MLIAYGMTIFISLLVASSELFTKFKDEPFKILTKHKVSWFYLLFNAFIASFCLYMLTQTTIFGTSESEILKAALTAGFGSTILMRSKFMKVNINGKEIAVGPELIINVYLETLERKIDRDRALIRKNVVEHCMSEIDFHKARGYAETTIIASLQNATPERIKHLMDEIKKIESSHQMGEKEKSFALGYLVMNIMGEDFLQELFNDHNKEEFLRQGQGRSG